MEYLIEVVIGARRMTGDEIRSKVHALGACLPHSAASAVYSRRILHLLSPAGDAKLTAFDATLICMSGIYDNLIPGSLCNMVEFRKLHAAQFEKLQYFI